MNEIEFLCLRCRRRNYATSLAHSGESFFQEASCVRSFFAISSIKVFFFFSVKSI